MMPMSRFLLTSAFLLLFIRFFAQNPQDAAVPVHISAGLAPPAVLINWVNTSPSDVLLRRRVKGQAGNSWTTLVNAQGTMLDGYFDFDVSSSEIYEYAVELKTGGVTAYGYGYANFLTPEIDYRGKLIVFVDSTTADQLGADLIAWKNDMRGEGWQILPYHTGPSTTVQWIKSRIQQEYNADPVNVKAVVLIGEVPVPYSGSLARDNQPDHAGAWPADAYYGDVNGIWTDNTVNVVSSARLANRNVPGDGKFDQNNIPSPVELAVGRLDFRHLSAGVFGLSPVELLRRYFQKNHLYRTGQLNIPAQALVDDNLGWSAGEAFAADGYRNAYPLTGPDQVYSGDILANTNPQKFLTGYAAGAFGSYSGASGIGTSAQVAQDTVQVVFAGLFGNYFGDWDYEFNPLMPAFLATRGAVLACGWAGRPHWMLQGLASGETIGFCLKETQNAQYNDAYGHFNGESGTHVSLLGDPTLRAQVVRPVTNLTANSNCTKVNLHWTAAADPDVLGYIVYRAFDPNGPFNRVSTGLVTSTSWEDLAPVSGTIYYSIRALKLETIPGGGAFYNTSTGPIQSVVFVPGNGPTAIGLGGSLNCNNLTVGLGTNFQPPTCTYQWFKPNGQPLGGTLASEGGVYTVVVTAPNGCTTAAYATVFQDTMLPEVNFPQIAIQNCVNPLATYTVPAAQQDIHYSFNGAPVTPGQVLTLHNNDAFTVSSSGNGCSKTFLVSVQQDFTTPVVSISGGGTLDCNHSSVQLTAAATPPGAAFSWSSGENTAAITAAAPGQYCCTATLPNGCTSSSCAQVFLSNSQVNPNAMFLGDPCAAGSKTLQSSPNGGVPPYQYMWSTGSTGNTTTVPGTFTGNVSLTVTDASGCMSTATLPVAAGIELLALTTRPSSPMASDGHIDLFVTGGLAPLAYSWSNGAATEDIFSLSSNTYTVTVTGANGCTAVLSVPLYATSAVSEPENDWHFEVSPIPVGDEMHVSWKNFTGNYLVLKLYDLSGRSLGEKAGVADSLDWDLSDLPAGVYFLFAETDKGNKIRKVVK